MKGIIFFLLFLHDIPWFIHFPYQGTENKTIQVTYERLYKSHPEPKAYTCGRQPLVSGLVRGTASEWGLVPGVGMRGEGDSKTYGATSINVDATGKLFLSRVLRVGKPLIAK